MDSRSLCAIFIFLAFVSGIVLAQSPSSPTDLHKIAGDYYRWRDVNYPVNSSDQGLHTWDDKLTDYSPRAIADRAQHVRSVLQQVRGMNTASWAKDDKVDWILFRAELEEVEFYDRVLQRNERDPQVYVNEASNGIFSLLKKEYDAPRTRALAATARLKQVPGMIEQGKRNLKQPVRLYAQLAIDSARAIDPLLTDSLMTLTKDMPAEEKTALIQARDAAIAALHSYADWLQQGMPKMVAFSPMGEANYN